MPSLPGKQLYLIGGAAGAGKTTIARQLASELGAGWLQADTLWIALRAALPAASAARQALEIDRAIRLGDASLPELLAQHITGAEVVCHALAPAIEFELLNSHDHLVVDGAWVLPEWVRALRFREIEPRVHAVFIHEPEAAEVKRAMRSRSSLPATLPWQARGAEMSWMYGNWLAEDAHRLGVPRVEARPRETLLGRVRNALGVTPQE